MRPVTIVALPLSIALLAGGLSSAPAAADSSATSAEATFVPADAWRVKGYARFKASEQASGPATCEAERGLAANTPVRYHVARKAKGDLEVHATQYVVQMPSDWDATQFATKLSEPVRRKCAALQRRDTSEGEFAHRYHVRAPVQVANGGGAQPPLESTLAIWSTRFQERVIEVFNGSEDGGSSVPENELPTFGKVTVVAVATTGRYVTMLTIRLEETTAPPWQDLRKTARIAIRMLAPDPWAA